MAYYEVVLLNLITDLSVVVLQLISSGLDLFVDCNGLLLLGLHLLVNSEVVLGEMVDSNGFQHLSLLLFIFAIQLFEVFVVLSQGSLENSNCGGLLLQPLKFFTQILVLALQLFYFAMDLLDLDVILNAALQSFELVHQIHLSLLLQLQNPADVLLLRVLLHYQEQHQLHQLRHVFALQQLLPVGPLDPQVLHLHQIFLNLREVVLVVELLLHYLGEIGGIDASKQRGQQTRLPHFRPRVYLAVLPDEGAFAVDPHQ